LIRVTKKDGEHYFDVDHHVKQTYWLVSSNRRQPQPKACDENLWKLISRRAANNGGTQKGRTLIIFRSAEKLVAGAMGLHVESDGRLFAEIVLHSELRTERLRQQAVSYLTWCARQLAAGINNGDETFYLAVGRRQEDVRRCACSAGMKALPTPRFQLLRRQTMLVYRTSQRVEVVPSHSKARA